MATTKKRMFKVEVDGKEYGDGWLVKRPSSTLQCLNVSVYCPKCDNIWARLKWALPDQRLTHLSHCKCGDCGGTGLILPLFSRDAEELEFPVGVLRRDFLICMEKKIGWSPGYRICNTPRPALTLGCNWWPRLNFEWGYLDECSDN